MFHKSLFFFVVMLFLGGCVFFEAEEEIPVEVEEQDVAKPVEVGAPEEKVEKIEKPKEMAPTEEKEEEPEKEEAETPQEKKPVCEKDACAGNVLQKCVLGKAIYNITCPDLCKDAQCVEKKLSAEEFLFQDIYVGKALGSRKQVLSENDLKALSTTKVSGPNGLIEMKYLLRFGGDADDAIESGKLAYEKNRANKVADYLKFTQGDDLFEYVIDFARGFESRISTDNRLDDMVGVRMSFFGTPYTIVAAQTDPDKKGVSLKLLRGSDSALLVEGSSQTFMRGDKEYEVEATLVDSRNNKARLTVNGKSSPDLRIGDLFKVDDALSLAVKDILNDEEDDRVELFIGAGQVELTDNDAGNNQFERNVRVDDISLDRGRVMIRATSRGGLMHIDLLKYRADAKGTENDVYVPVGEDVRNHLLEPESLLAPNWGLVYDGFAKQKTSTVELRHRNARNYELSFTNTQGKSYTVPFMDSTNTFRFGDDSRSLVFTEDSAGNIARDDYFVLTDSNSEKGLTYVYQLLSLDRDNKKVQIKDLAGVTRDATYDIDGNGAGAGSFSFSGKTFNFAVPANGTKIGVDLNGNGNVGTDKVIIVTEGGLMIDLGVQDISGKSTHDVLLTTAANNLKESSGDEVMKVTVTKGSEITLTVPDQNGLHLESVGTDLLKGMTAYGAVYEVSGSTKKDLKIDYPQTQMLGTVKLVISQ
ncbi:hypothetical protein HY639_00695 [Candidatus Woesearchaeota archaeon]|nr:hypothetical protein [Candidatus Woesearchaeota archaeon]